MVQHYFGHRIRDYRKARGLSQSDLAARLGKSTSTISSYETDAKSIPVDSLIPLAEVFGITIDELIYCDNFEAVSVKKLSLNEKQIVSDLIRVIQSKQITSEEEKLEILVKIAHMMGLFFKD